MLNFTPELGTSNGLKKITQKNMGCNCYLSFFMSILNAPSLYTYCLNVRLNVSSINGLKIISLRKKRKTVKKDVSSLLGVQMKV